MDVGLLMGGTLTVKSVRHAFEVTEQIRRAEAAGKAPDRV